MSGTIWKFPLDVTDSQTVALPEGAKIISVQAQGDQPCLWAIVNPEAPKVPVEIRTHGTGHELPKDSQFYQHIGTYQLNAGALVFHVFRLLSPVEAIIASGLLR